MNGKNFSSNREKKEANQKRLNQASAINPNRPRGSTAYGSRNRQSGPLCGWSIFGQPLLWRPQVPICLQESSIPTTSPILCLDTCNGAVLLDLLEAYKLILELNDDQIYEIKTCSKDAIDCTTVWCRTWMNKKWCNSKNKPNADMLHLQEQAQR